MAMRTSYQVVGMTCGHCVQAVTAELSRLPGVSGVSVDLPSGEVTVISDGPVPIGEVRSALDEAGYTLAAP